MYLGKKKISSTKEEAGIVAVELEDGTIDSMDKAMFEFMKTEEESDASTLQQRKLIFIESKLYDTLLKYKITLEECRFVFQRLSGSISDNAHKKISQLFGKDNTGEGQQAIPFEELITLQDIHCKL